VAVDAVKLNNAPPKAAGIVSALAVAAVAPAVVVAVAKPSHLCRQNYGGLNGPLFWVVFWRLKKFPWQRPA